MKPALRSLRWCASWRQSKQHEPVPLLLVLQVLRYSVYSMYVPNADDSTGSVSRPYVRAILVRTKAYQAAVRLNVVQ